MDNVFDIVARFRARRPIGSIPDGDREPLLLVQTGSRFQPTPCSVAYSPGVQQPGYETDLSPLSSVAVKNGVVHPPHSCIVHRGNLTSIVRKEFNHFSET